MPFPGKITIGLLQEDNPEKAYFRFKPLFVLDARAFVPVMDQATEYPEEGFIRIVPDKNESFFFKARMRQNGPICLLDLRRHLIANNKIRPNKKYFPGGAEKNANIVYSDVIAQLPPLLMAEIVDASAPPSGEMTNIQAQTPLTPFVALRIDGVVAGLWRWHDADLPGHIALLSADSMALSLDEQAVQSHVICLSDAEGHERPALVHLDEFGVVGEMLPPTVELPPPAKEAPSDALPHDSLPDEPAIHCITNEPPEQTESAPTHPPREPSQAEQKPWLFRDEGVAPRAVSSRLSPREQTLHAQTGINPRRGRSLSEVIDDQWRRSRIDQLGHAVSEIPTGRPVVDPVEKAIAAVSDACVRPELRGRLIGEMMKNPDLVDLLLEQAGVTHNGLTMVKQEEILNAYEASRLQLLDQIKALETRRAEAKNALLLEVQAENAKEMRRLDERKNALALENERREKTLLQTQAAVSESEARLSTLFGDEFEQRVFDGIARSRVFEILTKVPSPKPAPEPVQIEECHPAPDELIERVFRSFDAAGWGLSRDDSVNLLLLLAMDEMIVVSGEPGVGKTGLIANLSASLGLPLVRTFDVGRQESSSDERVRLMLIDDVNVGGDDARLERAISLHDQKQNPALRVAVTVQDAPDGRPLTARLFERAALIRRLPPAADSPLRALERVQCDGLPVSLEAISALLESPVELPADVTARLRILRAKLQLNGWRMSHRTIAALSLYLGVALKHMHADPMDILDRALAQRALPAMLAAMPMPALVALRDMLYGLPRCLALLKQPLPLPGV